MNKVVLVGRLTRDPEVRYSSGDKPMAIARYSLAVNRNGKTSEGAPTADFINIVAFGRDGEFAEKYLRKGTKILVEGHIQTGSYTNKDGQKVYTTDVVVERHEFVENKATAGVAPETVGQPTSNPGDGFVSFPEGIEEELPFN